MLAQTRVTFRKAAGIGMTALMLAGLLGGCSGGDNKGGDTKAVTENAQPVTAPPASETGKPPAPEPQKPAFTAPLTGLPSDHEVTKRPIAVMINNFSAARPQSGLPHADVVWEILAEGGITRLVGIFQSDEFKDPIGPVRSIRPYLIELGESYGGVLVHAGGSNDAYAILQHSGKADLDEIANAGSSFWRDKSRKAPHNLYTNLEKLRAAAAKRKFDETVPVPKMTFSPDGATAAGAPASSVEIHFLLKKYVVSYIYEPDSKLYARSINGKPHTDLTTGGQLTTSNIAVLGAKHHAYDDYGRLEIDLASGGPAVLIQLGKAVECTWERGADGGIHLMKDGQELPMVPGKTYYHVVPMTPTFAEHVKYS